MLRNSLVTGSVVILLYLVGVFVPVFAETSPFNEGKRAFQRGDYRKAVQAFELARKHGETRVALYYNLGVSYYKLGNFDDARINFEIVARNTRMAGLAHYNLGLVARKQNKRDVAISEFKLVSKTTRDEKLIILADRNLEALYSYQGIWRGAVLARFGYDTNVTAAATDQPAGSSPFLSLGAYADYLIRGTRDDGLYFTGDVSLLDYTAQDEDQNSVQGGIKKTLSVDKYKTHYAGYFSSSTYRGSAYQNILRLEGGARNDYAADASFRLHYRYDNISSLNTAYDYLQGWRQRLRVERRGYGKQDRTRMYYELELNDRQDPNYSPTRHTVRGVYSSNLSGTWGWDGDVSFRFSDYPLRDDQRLRLSLTVSRRLDADLKLQARIRHSNNNSTDPVYTYNSNEVWAGVSYYY